jgi:spermidine synthase/MFS family permease
MSTPDQIAVQANDISSSQKICLYACFFLSGIAGLIYEVLWEKYLGLFVGSTGLAQIIVLSTYMSGLALGGWFWGRFADRKFHPLLLYVLLELAIGVYALFFNQVFGLGRSFFLKIGSQVEIGSASFQILKLLSCILLILLPTFLMGGTLPVMGKYLIRSLSGVGRRISLLYFLNSIGAVIGCLMAGFVLIRVLGLQSSMILGAILNFVVALAAYAIFKTASEPPLPEKEEQAATSSSTPALMKIVLVCVALSGAVSMMYEIAWIRMLTLVLGSSTFSFTLMLATFIFGLSLGGLLLSFRKKQSGYATIFGLAEIGVGLTVLLSLPIYVKLPYYFNNLAALLNRDPSAFAPYQFMKFGLCIAVMLIPTILQGITLPAATQVLTREMKGLGKRVGSIFAINTIGTCIGAAFAGAISLAWLGIRGTLELAVFINLILGAVVLLAEPREGIRKKAYIVAAVCIVVVAVPYIGGMRSWNENVMSAGAYRIRDRISSYQSMLDRIQNFQTLYYRDGIDASIAVQDVPDARGTKRLLIINGKVDAGTNRDLPTQKMLGHMPMLLQPGAKDVLVVGAGSGATSGAVLCYDSVKSLDVIEISGNVIEVNRDGWFDAINGRYYADPRTRIFHEDAKTVLQVSDKPYDIIISEPTNPWIAGVAGVFSQEYFEACRNRLVPGGKFVFWLQSYELESNTLLMMLDTFTSVFPYQTIWNSQGPDLLVVGSTQPYEADLASLTALLAQPAVKADLAQIKVDSLLPILSMQMNGHSRQPAVTWLGAIHRDYFPVLDYLAPRGFFIGKTAEATEFLDHRRLSRARSQDLWIHDYLDKHTIPAEEYASTLASIEWCTTRLETLPYALAVKWNESYPDDTKALLKRLEYQPPELSPLTYTAAKDIPSPENQVLFTDLFERYQNHLTYLSDSEIQQINQFISDGNTAEADPVIRAIQFQLQLDAGDYAEVISGIHAFRIQNAYQALSFKIKKDLTIILCEALLANGEPEKAEHELALLTRFSLEDLDMTMLHSRIMAAISQHPAP